MLSSTSTDGSPPLKPSKQQVVDWIVEASHMIDCNRCIVKKFFLVTGLSNSLGGHEDHLIQNDLARKEIDEIITESFWRRSHGISRAWSWQ